VITKFTTDKVGIFLVRPKSFAAEETGGGAAAVEELTVPDLGATGAATITNRFVEEQTGPSLDDAAVVVAGGEDGPKGLRFANNLFAPGREGVANVELKP
jgi:electron transfer flavoprotein alpha subunit